MLLSLPPSLFWVSLHEAARPDTHGHGGEQERQIVQRLRASDTEALAELMQRYTTRLVRFAFHAIGSWDIADDIVQAVFIQVWDHRDTLDADRSLKSYLFRAVRNRALDVQKSDRVRETYRRASLAEGETEAPSPEPGILTVAEVQAAMARLPERRRLALRLRLEEEMSHAEIAVVLGGSPAAVQSLVSRAIADLREMLKA